MHAYLHHIGDFDKDTRHLTRIERSIYRDLMDLYYLTELCLPDDIGLLCRKVIAQTNDERSAVEQVLKEFFYPTPMGWYHVRCEEEIEKYKANQSQRAAAGRASAEKRAEKLRIAMLNPTGVEQALNGAPTNQEPKPITKNQEPKEKILTSSDDDESAKIRFKDIVDTYHRVLPELPSVIDLSDKRKAAIRSCLKFRSSFADIEFWEAYFNDVRESDFLMGRKTKWKAGFDFLTNKTNLIKVLEGNYNND